MPISKNFIGLNRARRPHNAIFVSFNDPTVPTECLEAAKVNWSRYCQKENDRQAEEQLKKVFVQLQSAYFKHNTPSDCQDRNDQLSLLSEKRKMMLYNLYTVLHKICFTLSILSHSTFLCLDVWDPAHLVTKRSQGQRQHPPWKTEAAAGRICLLHGELGGHSFGLKMNVNN